jgi:bifunctional non-homologous end joining protein LigD
LHEIKFDGYRMLCILSAGQARLISRNGNDWTGKLFRIARAAIEVRVSKAILDGEVVALRPDGSSDFQALQNSLKRGAESRLYYYVFDLPHCDGYDLTRTPLIERKRLLYDLLALHGDPLRYSDHVIGDGPRLYERACSSGLEGIVSKHLASRYVSKRTRSWVKIKFLKRQEFVVGGYTDPRRSRTGFGALLLGYHDKEGKLIYCGRVGTGFNAQSLADIHRRLAAYSRDRAPFHVLPQGFDARGVHWVRPELVVEVAYAELTRDRTLRHPSFQGLREDKAPQEVVWEAPVEGREET